MDKYRLYIDESGTHGYSTSDTIKQRYLSLTGVFISEEETINNLQPRIASLKRLVADDPDDLPVLHRDEIVNKTGAFTKLNDDSIRGQFDEQFLSLLDEMDYCVCSIVLDKKTHLERYEGAAMHPYHYCMNMLLERYTFHLEEKGGRGAVLAEARMPDEDHALREEYTSFYEGGTYYCRSPRVQAVLTSRELKLKPKSKKIAGLEFVDMLALATKLDTLNAYGILPTLTENYCKTIIDHIQPKYRRSQGGFIMGFGKKLVK